jgi:hypothetical protein
MNTVWVFGDSFSVDFNLNPTINCRGYIKHKGYIPKTFGKLISEHYDMGYENHARGGFDNYSIMETFCNVVDMIKDGDIIFLGWSHYHRFRIIAEKKWMPINGPIEFENISINTVEEILVNRNHPYYEQEVESWEKLIKHSLKPLPNVKLIVWKWWSPKYNSKFETISKETNGIITDFHWSENGHKQVMEYMIPIIEGTPKFI